MNQSARTFIASKAPRKAFKSRGSALWRIILLVLVLGVAAGFAVARFLLNDQLQARYDQLKKQFDNTVAQAQADTARLQAALDTAQGRLAVEQSTRKGLEASLGTLQKQLGQAHDQLAFFHQLFPPGPRGSINIRAFDVRQQQGILTYKVLLSRNATDDAPFKGVLQFEAQGREHGKTVKISLVPEQIAAASGAQDDSAAQADSGRLALSFDQFQRREGELALPEGFTPDTVTLSVLQGDTVRVSRTVKVS